jgi:hypothetical protein
MNAAHDVWKAEIEEAIDALPENPTDLFTPEEIGRMDFDEGRDCDPTEHYAKLGDCEAYIIGYRQAEDTAEYVEDIDDRGYWAHGGW